MINDTLIAWYIHTYWEDSGNLDDHTEQNLSQKLQKNTKKKIKNKNQRTINFYPQNIQELQLPVWSLYPKSKIYRAKEATTFGKEKHL